MVAEFNKITIRTAIGFVVMGFIGFFVKLIFIVSLNRLYIATSATLFARLAELFVVFAAHQPNYCWRECIVMKNPVRYSTEHAVSEDKMQFQARLQSSNACN